MTVADLIAALQTLPQDHQVVMPSNMSLDFVALTGPILDVAMPAQAGGWQLCDYEDDGVVTVVRLLGSDEIDDRAERPRPPTS